MTRPRYAIIFCLLIACCALLDAADSATTLIGTFSSRPSREGLGTDTVVEDLQITIEGDKYRLNGTMNATNREAGMDRTSNTFWSWSGEGRLVDGAIRFTYQAKFVGGATESGRGSFRRSKSKYVLTIDGADYTLHKNI